MERRLAAVLSYDLVGFGKAMGADEAGTLDLLKHHRRDVIEPNAKCSGGRIIKLMGDGALMEFASVVDAVIFAVRMQQSIANLNATLPAEERPSYRIGINVGDVIVEGDDIYGDGVNIAARLERLAAPGGICIRRNVRNQVRDKLDLDFEDLGEIEVKNIDRAVRVFNVVLNEKAASLAAAPVGTRRKGRPRQAANWAAAGIMALLLIAMIGWSQPWVSAPDGADQHSELQPVLGGKPSIAVLPFDTLGDAEPQRLVAEGMAEDITTELARNVDLTVMARTATFSLRQEGLDAIEIAKALGVRYALEGSVRRAGEELRIVAQLIDGHTGRHLWAERYEIDASQIYETYDDIVDKIVGTLFSEVRHTEKAEALRRPPDNLDVYELSLRGLALKHRLNAQDLRRARSDLLRAVEMDPDYAPAWLYLGWVEVIAIIFEWDDELRHSDLENAMAKIESAISLDPTLASAYQALSLARTVAGDQDGALQAARRSVELGPGDADNRLFLGRAMASDGQFEEAVAHARQAVALNPSRPSYYDLHLGRALWGAGEFEESARLMEDCLTKAPEFTACRVFQIASRMDIGDVDAAAEAVGKLRAQSPGFSVEDASTSVGFPGDVMADRRLATILTEAGLPTEDRAPTALSGDADEETPQE